MTTAEVRYVGVPVLGGNFDADGESSTHRSSKGELLLSVPLV